jgi:prepilin-type processing-associated H-X9-DG protein
VVRIQVSEGRRTILFADGHLESDGMTVSSAQGASEFAASPAALCWRSRGESISCALDRTYFLNQPAMLDLSWARTSTMFAVGLLHVCALASDRTVACIGEALDWNSSTTSYQPQPIDGLAGATQLVTGGWSDPWSAGNAGFATCGLIDGAARCVGRFASTVGSRPTYHAAPVDLFGDVRDR